MLLNRWRERQSPRPSKNFSGSTRSCRGGAGRCPYHEARMADQGTGRQRVLLTGGSGLLALNWACAVRDAWDVVLGTHRHGVELKGASSYQLNLDDQRELERQLAVISPDLL